MYVRLIKDSFDSFENWENIIKKFKRNNKGIVNYLEKKCFYNLKLLLNEIKSSIYRDQLNYLIDLLSHKLSFTSIHLNS